MDEQERLAQELEDLDFVDKAREVQMSGQGVTREKNRHVKPSACEDFAATFVAKRECSTARAASDLYHQTGHGASGRRSPGPGERTS